MGNDANGVWTATNLVPPAAETPQNVFPVRQVAGSSKPFQRFCLRRLYAGQYSPAGITTMCLHRRRVHQQRQHRPRRRPVGWIRLSSTVLRAAHTAFPCLSISSQIPDSHTFVEFERQLVYRYT
jgi:hypothetical protein